MTPGLTHHHYMGRVVGLVAPAGEATKRQAKGVTTTCWFSLRLAVLSGPAFGKLRVLDDLLRAVLFITSNQILGLFATDAIGLLHLAN